MELKYGPTNERNGYQIDPHVVLLEVLPAILNKMVIFIIKGTTHMSFAAIETFCHFLMLFKRMLNDFPEVQKVINSYGEELKNSKNVNSYLHKANFPDIGNFLVLLCFARDSIIDDKLMLSLIMKECMARQIYWIFFYKETEDENNQDFLELLIRDINLINIDLSQYELPLPSKDKEINKEINKDKINENKTMLYGKDNENLIWHFYYHKFQLIDLCTDETKKTFMKLVFSKTHTPVLFTFKAVKTFINKESIEKLTNNYSIVEENEAESFVKFIKSTNEKIKSYSDFLEEIGLTDFLSESYTEFDNLISSTILARNQNYLRLEHSVNNYLITKEGFDSSLCTKGVDIGNNSNNNSNNKNCMSCI